jgi:hypothetical protein
MAVGVQMEDAVFYQSGASFLPMQVIILLTHDQSHY